MMGFIWRNIEIRIQCHCVVLCFGEDQMIVRTMNKGVLYVEYLGRNCSGKKCSEMKLSAQKDAVLREK